MNKSVVKEKEFLIVVDFETQKKNPKGKTFHSCSFCKPV